MLQERLSPEQRKELADRPFGTQFTDFTESQLNMRIEIGKIFWNLMSEMDSSLTEEMKAIYEKYPLWAFYTDEDEVVIKRSFGVGVYENGHPCLHTMTCMIMFTNETVGGTPVENVIRTDRWNADQLDRIKLNNAPGMFCDPLGFLVALRAYHQ